MEGDCRSMRYLNFDLLIAGAGQVFTARVLEAPAGEARASFAAPFTLLEAENLVLKIGRPRRGRRSFDSAPTRAAKELGGKLFDAAFSTEVRACLQESLSQAKSQGARLRIRLRLDAPDLADLPWEYLYNRALNSFVALSSETSLVRYLELPRALGAPAIDIPLKVLAIIADPIGSPPLAGEDEWQNLVKALAPLAGQVQVERLEPPTLAALQASLRRTPFHVIHFVGHGVFDEAAKDGALLFEDASRSGERVSAERLAAILHNHSHLRLVILNCCEGARLAVNEPFSGVARSLIQQGVPAVIAMQFEISDAAALTFSNVFYESLADGLEVDGAVVEARTAMYSGRDDVEFGAPVLFMRAPDGVLFHLHKPPLDPAAPPADVAAGRGSTAKIEVPPPAGDGQPAGAAETSRVKARPARRRLRLLLVGIAGVALLAGGLWVLYRRGQATETSELLTQAMRWAYGENGRVDEGHARQLLESAVQTGDEVAALWKAQCIFFGWLGYVKDPGQGEAQARQVTAMVESRAKAGDALAGLRWGVSLMNGIGVAQDQREAWAWEERICNDAKLPAACNNLGVAYKDGMGIAKNSVKAFELFGRACNEGCLIACFNLGDAYEEGSGVPKDLAHAAQIYSRACEGNEAFSCGRLGHLYSEGWEGVPADPAKAAAHYSAACAEGNLEACNSAGIAFQSGKGVEVQPAKAAQMYGRACDGGNLLACSNLGGLIRAADPAKAAELYRRACDGGSAAGCNNLGVLAQQGTEGRPDQGRAKELFRRACDGGEALGCLNLGDLALDLNERRQLYDRACDGGNAQGCLDVSNLLQDEQLAAVYRSRACKAGLESACGSAP